MTPINLESEIVSTGFDHVRRIGRYTVERNACRWTVEIPETEFAVCGANKTRRKQLLSQKLTHAIASRDPDHQPIIQQLSDLNKERHEQFGRGPQPDNPLPLPHTGIGGDVADAPPQ